MWENYNEIDQCVQRIFIIFAALHIKIFSILYEIFCDVTYVQDNILRIQMRGRHLYITKGGARARQIAHGRFADEQTEDDRDFCWTS